MLGSRFFFLIYFGGLILAMINARRLKGAAVFAILGCSIGLINTLGTPLFFRLFNSTEAILVVSLVRSLISGAGLALLVVAIFVGRPRVPDAPPPPPPPPPNGQI